MFRLRQILIYSVLALAACKNGDAATKPGAATVHLLNVSYDPTRELYEAENAAFAKTWKAETGQEVVIQQSHGGSGKQARSVIDGLEADVVTLGLAYDVDAIANAGLLPADWATRLGHNATPFSSTIVFLVRKGNPKGIKDWDDLVKDDVKIIVPNPKTSGGARWAYLAAWGYALKKSGGDEKAAQDYTTRFYRNVAVLDTGARGSTTTFVERGIGDVLVGWENEAQLAASKLGADKVVIVVPSVSVLAEPPVAVVAKVAAKHGTETVAKAYLDFLYTDEAQEIAARNFYRPTAAAIADKHASQFPKLGLFTVDEVFGGWTKAQARHFSDGGLFDQIYQPGK
jgi:sulfate transport system substrate-binding protein